MVSVLIYIRSNFLVELQR